MERNGALDGGGMSIHASCAVTSIGTMMDGNIAKDRGGGAFLVGGPVLKGGMFLSGFAPRGGGMFATGGTVSLSNLTVGENNAGRGGGLFIDVATTVHANNITVDGNTADRGAGAYLSLNSELDGQSSTLLTSNMARQAGGGAAASEPCTLRALTISNCSASSVGGGLHLSLEGSEVLPSVVAQVVIFKCKAGNGGGLYVNSSTKTAKVRLLNVSISGNDASRFGGGIFAVANTSPSHVFSLQSIPKLTVEASAVTLDRNSAAEGGGALLNGVTFEFRQRCVVHGNSAQKGGGVFAENSRMLPSNLSAWDELHMSKNVAPSGMGGNFFLRAFTRLHHVNISGGVSSTGAGVLVSPSSSSELKSCHLWDNAADTLGGGLYVAAGANVSIYESSVQMNSATEGGGVYLGSGAKIVASMLRLLGNEATGIGGGLQAVDSTVDFSTCELSKNTAVIGGGASVVRSELGMWESSILGNNVKGGGKGGGIFSESSSVRLRNCSVAVNVAESGEGGGLYVKGSSIVRVLDSSVELNSAALGGAVRQLEPAQIQIKTSVLRRNLATSKGGGGTSLGQRQT